MKRLQNFFARCSLFELNEGCQESKLHRVFFRNILRIIISKVVYFLENWNKRQKVYGKIPTSGVAENKHTSLNLISQMKQEFTCLCGCYHQDSDFVPQNRSNSQKYKKTRQKWRVTHFAGRTAQPHFMLIICHIGTKTSYLRQYQWSPQILQLVELNCISYFFSSYFIYDPTSSMLYTFKLCNSTGHYYHYLIIKGKKFWLFHIQHSHREHLQSKL